LAIGAIICLALNDHLFKGTLPGVVTGKLSDVAGLVFVPLLLATLIETGLRMSGVEPRSKRRLLAASLGATALVFAAVKLSTPIAQGYGDLLGWLRWPWLAAGD